MQDFTITTKDKAAIDAFTTRVPGSPSPLLSELQGRRIEFAPLAPLTTWQVEPVIGIGEDGVPTTITQGQGMESTYRATLRVWDSEPVNITAPEGVTIAPRGVGGAGFDLALPVPPEAIPVGIKVAFPDVISDRQFAQGLAHAGVITQAEALAWVGPGELPPTMSAFVAQMPEASRFDIEMVLTGATQFSRSHPLTAVFGEAVGMVPQQLDQFWMMCAAL
jgi:hypothetical protein